ncbi:putative odorant receptor 83c [Trichogramma pretiosum]|uniref:putative odorant receptor 83c n=1 Tax=Trichogramma pretiosum TaxID=7493 RepID=UPI000C71BBA6|nr:putative odorant receptor 83c [Trichogramma pretiosum]
MLVLPFEIWFSIEHMNDIDKLMECFGILTGILGYGSKLLMLRLSWRSVSSLVQIIISDYEATREPALRAALLKNYKIGTGVTKLLFGTYTSLAFFIPIENCIRIARNGYTPSLLYSVPTSYPMIKKTAKNHIMVNFVQLTQVIVAGSGHALCDVFFTVLVMHAAFKSLVLRTAIKRYFEVCTRQKKDLKVISDAMNRVILYHREFLKFTQIFEDAYCYVVFCQIFCITLQTVGSGYILILLAEDQKMWSVEFLKYINFIMVDVFSIMAYCTAGEYYTHQSIKIYEQLCKSSWYDLSISEMKSVLFLMIHTQKFVAITSGKFKNLQLDCCTSIMKGTYSYLSMFRATRNRD